MRVPPALLAWQTWAAAALFCAIGAALLWRARREARRPPRWSADERAIMLRAHRTTREVRWDEIREVRREGDLLVIRGAGEREVGMPLAEARRLGVLARLGLSEDL